MTTFHALLVTALVLSAVFGSVVILLQRRSAAATMAWLLALAFMPIIGLVIYRLFGPLRLERKLMRRRAGRRAVGEAVATMTELGAASEELAQLARVSMSLGGAAPLRARDATLFTDGESAYRAISEAIGAARHHVHLEYYIWTPDQIGTRMRDLLIARSKAGVAVRLILDGMGAKACKAAFLAPLTAAGVEVAWFNPVRLRGLRVRRPDFRTHRKIVICDGEIGFTGGMNITDAHTAEFDPNAWRDTHLRIAGPAVWALQRLFLDDWYFAREVLPEVVPAFFPGAGETAADEVRVGASGEAAPAHHIGHHIVQIVGSGPDSTDFAIQKAIFTAIGQAQKRLWLTTPYFVPDEAILTALIAAALRQVDVRLIVPQKGDSRLVDLAARSYFPELLRAGVRVFEYGPRFIHAKTMVVDDDVAIIGTANLDNRSFRLNFELVALVYGGPVHAGLAAAFEHDLTTARELPRERLESGLELGAEPRRGRRVRRPKGARDGFWTRLGQAGARLLSPLL